MQTNPAVEQSKIIRWSESLWNQSGRKGKGLWSKGRLCDYAPFSEYISAMFLNKLCRFFSECIKLHLGG